MMKNKADFRDAVVLDVGTRTGILAFFAIQAGAKKVRGGCALPPMPCASIHRGCLLSSPPGVCCRGQFHGPPCPPADEGQRLGGCVLGAGCEWWRCAHPCASADKVIILEGRVEEVDVPEKVDIIISEPIGFVLVHERMLECYVAARNRFLKPGGLMMPTTGTIFVAPFTDAALYEETAAKVCVVALMLVAASVTVCVCVPICRGRRPHSGATRTCTAWMCGAWKSLPTRTTLPSPWWGTSTRLCC